MANNRSNIRLAIKNVLLDETDAGSNVYTNRETKLWESELPAILIYTAQEPAIPESLSSQRYVRTLELRIEVKVKGTTDVDDSIDEVLGQIEDLIHANPSLNGVVSATILTNTEISLDSDAQEEIGVGVLSYECKYIS